eukprot:GHVS01036903.1.p1 GENE.GHVS01036903.1~~GHVS01036903.1.p1  ORF type:complete len:201 (+),score=13.09 GHVS01036903.1:646-1248(+)
MGGGRTAGKEQKRLQKELEDIQSEPSKEVDAHMSADNLYKWQGYIKGPEGSPYDGGYFVLDVSIPNDYPYAPPVIKFVTKIWHPNISSQTGAICLDILKKEWSPALTIRTALLSIQALLSDPFPDDPQDAEVAAMYKNNRPEFERTARTWTATFAQKSHDTQESKVKKITEMGFTEEQAQTALSKHSWDETSALNMLLDS